MPTIGRHAPSTTRNNYPALCAYCGAHWPRSELKRDRSGRLYCPDEGTGLDSAALSEIIAADGAMAGKRRHTLPHDGGVTNLAAPDPTIADHPIPGTTGAALLTGTNLTELNASRYKGSEL
jgi:hypothetical protein